MKELTFSETKFNVQNRIHSWNKDSERLNHMLTLPATKEAAEIWQAGLCLAVMLPHVTAFHPFDKLSYSIWHWFEKVAPILDTGLIPYYPTSWEGFSLFRQREKYLSQVFKSSRKFCNNTWRES